ncbi:DUF6151 family protein [Bdellovibrio sp. HCB337]|uniref:DUF6151 family protein n=1 Tax=Bdellovibrio sp. HCB337 TaxID=3394358 RepID=UPI0039A6D1A0
MQFKCRCGNVSGVIQQETELQGLRFICMCKDCQAYAHFLGNPESILDANGGTEVVPVFPKLLQITKGFEHVRGVKLSEKTGLFRWYAGCCRSPIANSLPSQAGYIGLVAARLGDLNRETLGPIRLRVNGESGIPPLPEGTHKGTPSSWFFVILGQILRMYLKRWKRPNPFFDASNKPIAPVEVLVSPPKF